jgi:hypothetical protein
MELPHIDFLSRKKKAPALITGVSPLSELASYMDLPPPPDVIPVPEAQLYHPIQNGDFLEYLHPVFDEGWKLHIPLPDSGYLYPHVLVRFQRKEGNVWKKYEMPAQRYYTSSAHQRQGDIIDQDIRLRGYADLFLWLQKKKVAHKFVPKVSLLRQMEQLDPVQKGKFLTIYPSGHEEMMKIISHAECFLSLLNFHGCFNISKGLQTAEFRVPSLCIITTRYGRYTGFWVLGPADQRPATITQNNSLDCIIKDDRNKCKPDHIRSPWPELQPQGDEWGWHKYPTGVNVP